MNFGKITKFHYMAVKALFLLCSPADGGGAAQRPLQPLQFPQVNRILLSLILPIMGIIVSIKIIRAVYIKPPALSVLLECGHWLHLWRLS